MVLFCCASFCLFVCTLPPFRRSPSTPPPPTHTQNKTKQNNSTYKLSVGGFCNLDLTQALNGQPLQLTCKDTKTGEYSFSMLVWHERLLYDAPVADAGNSLSDAFSKMRLGWKGYFSRGGTKSAGGVVE